MPASRRSTWAAVRVRSTTGLVEVLGADHVVAVDPSAPFVAANRQRNPGVEVHGASAEELPFDSGRFDVALAQLVVHFMTDPVAGLREMARVVRPGGVVAACVWDHGGGRSPVAGFWHVAHSIDRDAPDESAVNGSREGHLAELFKAAGLGDLQHTVLSAAFEYHDFDTWWQPFALGVGPAGEYYVSCDERRRDALRDGCRELLGPPPFTVSAKAWAAKGVSVG